MKNFLHGRGAKLLLAVFCIMLGLILYTASLGGSVTASVLGFITTPMQKLSGSAATAAGDVAPDTQSYEELKAENEALKQKLSDMIALTMDYYDIKRENERNSKYLELKSQHKDYQFVSAEVIARDPADLFYGFTLDQGSISGVEKNDPVITDKGLVGWVSAVLPTSCKVTSILSPDTSVGAVDKVTRDIGVVSGNLVFTDEGLVKMSFIPAQNTIAVGNIIATSGVGGIYPGNLPIGEVLEVKHEESDVSLYAVIKPYEDIKNVQDVVVITDFLGQGNIATQATPADGQDTASSGTGSPVSSGAAQ